jgi:hypothetical protein
MRIALPAVLLLFGSASAGAQTLPAAESAASAPAPATAQPAPTASPSGPRAMEPASPETVTRTKPTTAAEPTVVQEKKRSRVVWFLVGAVVVLAIIVATQ